MTMLLEKQVEALNNALRYYEFPEKFFIHPMDERKNAVFGICTRNEIGGIQEVNHRFMPYMEMNAFISGYNLARTKPLF